MVEISIQLKHINGRKQQIVHFTQVDENYALYHSTCKSDAIESETHSGKEKPQTKMQLMGDFTHSMHWE